MSSKPYRIPNARDRLLKTTKSVKDLEALNRLRNTPRPVSAPRSSGSSAAGSTGGGTGNFLPLPGGTMTGNLAFDPKNIIVATGGRVNLDPGSDVPENSSYILVNDNTQIKDIRFIDGAERDGQYLIYQVENQQVQILKNAVLEAVDVVGDGTTNTITGTMPDTSVLETTPTINILNTTNFNVQDAQFTITTATEFTYDLGSIGSTTSEAGLLQNGNILTPNGTNVVLDGKTGSLNTPAAILIFDGKALAGGAWRVISTPIFASSGILRLSGNVTGFNMEKVIEFNSNTLGGSGVVEKSNGVFQLSGALFTLNAHVQIETGSQGDSLTFQWETASNDTFTSNKLKVGTVGDVISSVQASTTSSLAFCFATVNATDKDVFVRLLGSNAASATSILASGTIATISSGAGGGAGGGAAVSAAKVIDLGNLSGTFLVDFDVFSDRQLFGNQVGTDVTLNFANSPTNLSLQITIYMTPATSVVSLTIGGTIIFDATNDTFKVKPLEIDDFLVIQLISTDGTTFKVISVKKNDETDVIPSIPVDVFAIGNSSSTVRVSWSPPLLGSSPISYEITWSKESGENAQGGPSVPSPGTPITGITGTQVLVGGSAHPPDLEPNTTYFFWVRASNSAGTGPFFGGQQTNTEGIAFPGNVNFSVTTNVLNFDEIKVSWQQPAGGGALFTLTRNNPSLPDTILQTRSPSVVTIDDRVDIIPATSYIYTLQVFDGFGVQLGKIDATIVSLAIPKPALDLGVTGRQLTFSVPIPAGINICRVQWDTQSPVRVTAPSLQMVKTVAKGTAQTVVKNTPELSISTPFFVHAQFQLNNLNGLFNDTQTQITGTLSIPQKPEIDNNLSGNAAAVLKIGVDFKDTDSSGERAIFTLRATTSSGEYLAIPGNEWSRDNKPIDNIANVNQEDEILVPRAGGGWGAVGKITVVDGAVTSIDVTNGGNNYTQGTTVRIWDNNDNGGGNGAFKGTANVTDEQLTSVTIASGEGGDFYDNDNIVFLPASSPDSAINTLFVAAGSMTARIVAVNDAGTSPSDTETVSVNS